MHFRDFTGVLVVLLLVALLGVADAAPGSLLLTPEPTPTETPPLRPITELVRLWGCILGIFDYQLVEAGVSPVFIWVARAALVQLLVPDLRYWDTGKVVSNGDRSKGLDVSRLEISTLAAGFRFDFFINNLPQQLPGSSINILIDDPTRTSGVNSATYFGGYDVDTGIRVQWDGAGRWSTVGGPLNALRPINATVVEAPGQVAVTLPLNTVTQLGLDKPGMQFFTGTVGPMPERVYDRVPERGAFALGIAGSDTVPSSTYNAWTLNRFSIGRASLLYLDTDGDRRVDSMGYDRDGDNTLRFRQMEGPTRWTLQPRVNYQWNPVERTETGRRQTFIMEGALATYGVKKEDLDNDGSFAGPGEHVAFFAMLRRAFQE